MKYNIFQDAECIRNVVHEELGFKTKNKYRVPTKDIYFESYFYLCNRFGLPEIIDDYKKIMIWDFEVKEYLIRVELNSSYLSFIMFGNGSNKNTLSKNNFINYSSRSPYWVRYWRERERNKNKFINLIRDCRPKRELKIIEKLWNEFSKIHNLAEDDWTKEWYKKEIQEDTGKTKSEEFYNYLKNYNEKILKIEEFSHYKYDGYSNSKTKHALKTLRQFIRNLLSPIHIRDCSFNLKGRCDEDTNIGITDNNIKIKFKKCKKK